MTARRSRRRGQVRLPAGVWAAVIVAVALVLALHLAGFVLALAAVGGGGYVLGLHHRPVTARSANPLPASKPAPAAAAGELAALAAERDRLAADVGRLTAELSEARASATAAWDAAASRPPSPPRSDTAPLAARLLTDPLSGVRRLGRGQ